MNGIKAGKSKTIKESHRVNMPRRARRRNSDISTEKLRMVNERGRQIRTDPTSRPDKSQSLGIYRRHQVSLLKTAEEKAATTVFTNQILSLVSPAHGRAAPRMRKAFSLFAITYCCLYFYYLEHNGSVLETGSSPYFWFSFFQIRASIF